MAAITEPTQINDLPPYIRSWSVVCIPKFIAAALDRWQRNFGQLPENFILVACPNLEILSMGGLPNRVRELIDARSRLQHFTSCHRLYTVFLLFNEDAEQRREEIQSYLPWSESYRVKLDSNTPQLTFIEAIEDLDDDD